MCIELSDGRGSFGGLLLTRAEARVDGLEGTLQVDRLLVFDSDRGLEFTDLDLQFGNLVVQTIPLRFLPLSLRSVILAVKKEGQLLTVSKSEWGIGCVPLLYPHSDSAP